MKHRIWKTGFGLALLLLAFFAPGVQAQYSIDWSKIAGGGVTSTGGVYAVTGTIGQHDAGGPMTNGSFSLVGGFWGVIAAVQTPGAPLLSVTRSNSVVIVSWPRPADGWVLERTSSLTGTPPPWSLVAPPYPTNATTVWVLDAVSGGNQFYRLRK